MAISFNRSFNVQRLVKKLLWTVLVLFVGGVTLVYFVRSMNGTCSPFYNGLSFIGVSVGGTVNSTGAGTGGYAYCTTTGGLDTNTIYSPTMSASVLSVVGVIAVSVVLMTEFLSW